MDDDPHRYHAPMRRWDRIKAHVRRELWAENALPWRARLRVWEFALGGIAAAGVLYAALIWGGIGAAVQPALAGSVQTPAVRIEMALDHADVLRYRITSAAGETGVDVGAAALTADGRTHVLDLSAAQIKALRTEAQIELRIGAQVLPLALAPLQ